MVAPAGGGDQNQEASAPGPEGISAFVARVLDQLTLSAWLPAALLTASLALLLQFRAQKSLDVGQAIRSLTADPVRVLVMIVPLLVLATMITQAFSFEAIRALEGYWRRLGPLAAVRTVMTKRHLRRRHLVTRRRQEASERAFAAARPGMLRRGIPFPVVSGLEAKVLDVASPPLTPGERAQVDALSWRASCDPWRLAKVDDLLAEEKSYPEDSRILPTKLGNVLRATEDSLEHVEGDMTGFVLRRRELVPLRVQVQHDQFRTRLDMYCTLVFVSTALAVLSPIVLAGRQISTLGIAVVTTLFILLGWASYFAAIASARGYGATLVRMDRA